MFKEKKEMGMERPKIGTERERQTERETERVKQR